MIELAKLRAASVMQLKTWQFALAERLKRQFTDGFVKYAPLWKQARENVGSKSLVFGLDKWRTYYNRKDLLGYTFTQACLGSLENEERTVRMYARRLQVQAKPFIHEAIMEKDFVHCGLDLKDAQQSYPIEVQRMFLKFYQEEGKSQDLLWVAADFMEGRGIEFEPMHIRSGDHSMACPVVLHILKGLI